ncbi:hypothetical protein BDA96_10G329800 [Sorghum bicolor]|nr:hypothetical protein BDA96_10G329800 [Sorghum bicolor]OQU77032.1 hypothetical protein SORBI_3010G255400 [Sorghum bicolor]
MSGQPVQMNFGGSRLLQQHQPLQAASRHTGMDPLFSRMRNEMRHKIFDWLRKEMKAADSQSLEKLAEKLEEELYRLYSKADYHVMLKEQIEPRLQVAIRSLSSQGHQRQQMSRQTPSSSTYITMFPTPGSISNSYQDPFIKVSQNSTANSDSSAMCPVIMQQQVDHMVQAPGFSHHQISPANPIGANGAGCLNGQWSAMPLVQEQQPRPFSMNQSTYPLQHLGTHVGSGVDSRILENFSSYGSSDAQINGAMGSNMQLSAQKEFMNLSSYGSLPEKSLQREFNRHPPQGTQSNQNMDATNMLSTSRTKFALLTSQTTNQTLQPKPLIKSEVLDQTDKVNFRELQLPCKQIFQEQHYFEPNRPCSLFVREWKLGSGRDEQISSQGVLPYNEPTYSKANEGSDKIDHTSQQFVHHNIPIRVKSYSRQLFSPHVQNTNMVQREMSEDAAEQHVSSNWHLPGYAMTPDHKQSKLSTKVYCFFIHAKNCRSPIGTCKLQGCVRAQEILKHSNDCQRIDCQYRYCRQSKEAMYHYNNCVNKHCPVCSKANESLSRYCDQTNKRDAIERSFSGVHGDTIDIKLVKTETFDDQPPVSKRLKLQPMLPNVSDSAYISFPRACPDFVSQQAQPKHLGQDKRIYPKQKVKIETDMQPPPKLEITRSGTVRKIGAVESYAIPGVSNHLDSHVEQQNCLPNNDTNEGVIDIKMNASGSTDVLLSKTGKKKRKGISLLESLTLEQIYEHAHSTIQWVGQSKAKAEKNQLLGQWENVNSCQLCKVEKLFFEPPPKFCSPCGARIKKNAPYYSGTITESGPYYFCVPCYNESRSDSVLVDSIQFLKSKLEKKRNNDEFEEAWAQCDRCERWQHQICALFNAKRNAEEKDAEYICHSCCIEEIKDGSRAPLLHNTVPGAKDLPRTVLSDHIEEHLCQRLKEERQNRANKYGKSFNEVPGAEGLVVRVVSSVDKNLVVKPKFLELFQEENYPIEFPYKSKAILLFQRIDGVEVCLFGIYVQEYGAECALPNQRRVYLSYLDSVKYFRPEIQTVSGEALRTFVYHEILIGYLQHCKQRGFTSCYIWACPPLKGDDYIMYCHPEIQKTPKSEKLREWYLSMIQKATDAGIVVELTNLYEHFFNSKKDCKAKVTAARLPYFDGDYWPGAAEDIINQIFLPEDGKNLRKGKVKKTITKRALKAAGLTDLSGNASKDAMLMQKLGEAIYPMKEDLIMVHLQYSCRHCCILMVSGRRWVCNQCKSFSICDNCYNAEQLCDEKERHPINSADLHTLHPVEIDGVPKDTKDRDGILESEFFYTRQAFLSLCQGNNYQYDTLRAAKHSSMMLLYHLHNPTEPAFVSTCNVCKNDIKTGEEWRCKECDYDECAACYKHNSGTNHFHKLTKHPVGANRDAHRKKSADMAQTMLRLVVHAAACRGPCQYLNCQKLKSIFHHGKNCQTRASNGCRVCKKMWSIIQLHARACKEAQCNVPRCRYIKEHLRKMQRLQQQSESRRRAAVDEMMKQRAHKSV